MQITNDKEMAALLSNEVDLTINELIIQANLYTVAIAKLDRSNNSWEFLTSGEFGSETFQLLKKSISKGNIRWISTTEDNPSKMKIVERNAAVATVDNVSNWIKNTIQVTGRHLEPNAKTKYAVATAAAWRCQMDGCGEDLRAHLIPGSRGNYSYYAHIIASSSDGPRGDKTKSPQLSNEQSNLMLMCDKCHRLIDRVAPHRYSVEVLVKMRLKNIIEVARLLNSLKFPSAQMIGVINNIEGQGGAFDERIAEEAMWLSKLRKGKYECQLFGKNAHLGASSSTLYWASYFELLKNDIPVIKRLLLGTGNIDGIPQQIALFPRHSTSVMIAMGRLLGDAGHIHQFQFHRNELPSKHGGQWAWPDNPEPSTDKYQINIEKFPLNNETQAILRVNLTAKISLNELPQNLYTSEELVYPAIEITANDCSVDIIGHQTDLALLGKKIDEAYRIIQDQWRVQHVHLIVVAPTTACVRLGQKMQARTQAEFTLYERDLSHSSKPFTPTIKIGSQKITHVLSDDSISIN